MPDIAVNLRILLVQLTHDVSADDLVITNVRYFRDKISYDAFIGGDTSKGYPLTASFSATPVVLGAGTSDEYIVDFGEVPPPPVRLVVRVTSVA